MMIRIWSKATVSEFGVASLLSKDVETETGRKAISLKIEADARNPEMQRARWIQVAVVQSLHLDSTAGNVHGGSTKDEKKRSTMKENDPLSNRFSHPSQHSCPT